MVDWNPVRDLSGAIEKRLWECVNGGWVGLDIAADKVEKAPKNRIVIFRGRGVHHFDFVPFDDVADAFAGFKIENFANTRWESRLRPFSNFACYHVRRG